MTAVSSYALGIDVSSKSVSVALMKHDQKNAVWQRKLALDEAGLRELVGLTPPECPWIVEPTGRYSRPVVEAGRQAGLDVRRADPKRAQLFLASLSPRVKNDPVDARGLGRYGLVADLPAYELPSPEVDHLKDLLSARKGLSKSRSQLHLQAESLCDPGAKAALAVAVAALDERLVAVDAAIRGASQALQLGGLVQVMDDIQGVGPVTANALALTLGTRSFRTADQFVAYLGLDPKVRESGKWKGEVKLSKQGPSELRRLLFCCAKANLRAKVSPFKDHYERELAKGLPSTAALCSVARKLARTAWSLATHGTTYDPGRVYRQPEPEANH